MQFDLWFGRNPWVRKDPWRREWLPTPVFLPGKSHGHRSLPGYSSWAHKGLDTTKQLILSLSVTIGNRRGRKKAAGCHDSKWQHCDLFHEVQPQFPFLKQKSLIPSIWVSSKLHGKFKETMLTTQASANWLPLPCTHKYLFPFLPSLSGGSGNPILLPWRVIQLLPSFSSKMSTLKHIKNIAFAGTHWWFFLCIHAL